MCLDYFPISDCCKSDCYHDEDGNLVCWNCRKRCKPVPPKPTKLEIREARDMQRAADAGVD